MFQRLVTMLLCSSMLIGNTVETAYAASSYGNYAAIQRAVDVANGETVTSETEALEEVGGETDKEAETTGETADETSEESTETPGETQETSEESTEESDEESEATEESTEETTEEPETEEESTEETSEEPETGEESTEETTEEPETEEESTEETTEVPETGEESAEETTEVPETEEESTEETTEVPETTEENTEETTEEAEAEGEEDTEEAQAKDDRKITVKVTPKLFQADVAVTLTGEDAADNKTYITFYYREKGATDWERRTFLCYQPYKQELNIYSYSNERLKEKTTYEYIAGIGDHFNEPLESLTKTVKGEFTTQKDERKLQAVKISTGYDFAVIDVGYTGNKYELGTTMKVFYRKAGEETWRSSPQLYSKEVSYQCQYMMGEYSPFLEQGTKYEYSVILVTGNTVPGSPEEVTKTGCKLTGTFQTKKRNYTLDIKVDEEKTTNSSGVLKISAKGDGNDEKLYVNLKLSNGESYPVTLCKSGNYTETLIIPELLSNTKYTVTEAELYVKKYTTKTVIGTFKPNVSFTTKPFAEVEEIKLSKSEIYLNAGNPNSYAVLEATVLPQTANQNVIWSTSNYKVASVTGNGKVYPVSPEEATITVKDGTGKGVTATCKVTVRNYVVGRKTKNGYEEVSKLTISKNESVENLVLLEKNGGKLSTVEQFDVTVIRSAVAKWKDGKLTGTGKGKTSVRFEKDGIYSFIQLEVTEEPQDFAITGVDASDEKYPAITGTDGAYEIACKTGVTYTVRGQFDSADSFDPTLFEWTSSDKTVATVKDGVITPKKAGKVTIKVKHSEGAGTKEIKLIIKNVAKMKANTVYALTNLKSKMCLKDLDLAAVAGAGWEWKTPTTSLYTLSVNDGAYSFKAVYTKNDKYACEEDVNVYIGTYTKLGIEEKDGEHNHVLQTGGDSLYLQIVPEHTGTVSQKYTTYIPDVKGLNITWDSKNKRYKITASKEGKYTLKPEIRVKEGNKEKTILTGKYEIKAVKDAQACSIKVTTDTEGVTINQTSGQIKLNFSEEAKKQQVQLKAVVKDKNGKETETALEWKIADTSVAGIAYNKKESHKATLTVKGNGGSTILTVKAKDAAGYKVELPLEIRDIRPRVSAAQVTVNTAFDYDNYYGESLAKEAGNLIEIVSAYNNSINTMELYQDDKKTIETRFELDGGVRQNGDYFEAQVVPVDKNMKPGTYKCQIGIKTEQGEGLFYYPLKIKVVNKMPSVKVTMPKLNLFYMDEVSVTTINVSGVNQGVEEVRWEDNSKASGNGFVFENSDTYYYHDGLRDYQLKVSVSQKQVQVKNGKLADKGVAQGTLYVKLFGYAKPVEIKNYKINYTYKKPALQSKNSVSMISPEMGITEGSFTIYDPLKKITLGSYVIYEGSNGYQFSDVHCDNANVKIDTVSLITGRNSRVDFEYIGNGSKKNETLVCKVNSDAWRETLEVKHTIKIVQPAAKLEHSTITLSKAYKNKVAVELNPVEQLPGLKIYDIEVKGADKKAQKLIEKNVLNFSSSVDRTWGEDNELYVQMNAQELQKEKVAGGTYTFKVIPHYTTQSTSEEKTMKALTLKVVIKDQPAGVKVNPQGELNLLLSGEYGYNRCNAVLKATFNNVASDCYIEDAKLTGDYAQYFGVHRFGVLNGDEKSLENHYRLYIKEGGKLKAGQTYKLTIEYTIRTANGDKFTVSGDFKVKPKQTAPKITASTASVVLYTCSEASREITLEVPSNYKIQDIYGGVDCNKDGKDDIVVKVDTIKKEYGRAYVYMEIVNPEAVISTAKGKTYKVPVTMELEGRDGVSKDAKTTIKVTVKR